METFIEILCLLKVFYPIQVFHDYYLIWELLNVFDYLVCYNVELLVYFTPLPLTVFSLSDFVLLLELPSDVAV